MAVMQFYRFCGSNRGFGEGFQANSMAIAASQQDIVWG